MVRRVLKGDHWIAVLMSVMLAAVVAGCDNAEQAAADVPKGIPKAEEHSEGLLLRLSADEARRAGLKVEQIGTVNTPAVVNLFGTVDANRNRLARIVPPVAGRIAKIAADLGDQVEAGTILVMLESPELSEARSAYQQAQTELNLSKSSLERAQRLAAEGSIAQKEQLRARSDHEKAQAALNAALARLQSLGVSATPAAGAALSALAVTAPFAGTVVEKTAVLGEYAQAYQPLFTVADLSSVWIETNLYDRDLGDVRIGARAAITVNAYPDQRFTGTLTYISSILDKDTRTAKARVEVANPEGLLKPGMFANVEIEKAGGRPRLRVPETALVLLQGQMTAFVANGDGFEPRPVETGERNGGQIVVKSGLEPGDQVVVAGAYALKARLLKSQIGDAH